MLDRQSLKPCYIAMGSDRRVRNENRTYPNAIHLFLSWALCHQYVRSLCKNQTPFFMAISSVMIRSRTIVHHLSRKMGFLGASDKSSSFVQYATSSAIPLGHNCGRPYAFLGNSSATHFPVPRFKSTEAEREFDDSQSHCINEVDDNQV